MFGIVSTNISKLMCTPPALWICKSWKVIFFNCVQTRYKKVLWGLHNMHFNFFYSQWPLIFGTTPMCAGKDLMPYQDAFISSALTCATVRLEEKIKVSKLWINFLSLYFSISYHVSIIMSYISRELNWESILKKHTRTKCAVKRLVRIDRRKIC